MGCVASLSAPLTTRQSRAVGMPLFIQQAANGPQARCTDRLWVCDDRRPRRAACSAAPAQVDQSDLSKCAAGSPPPVPQSIDLLGLWPRREHSGSAQRHGVMSRRPTEFHGSPATRFLRICRHSPFRWRSPAAGRRRLVGAMALLEVRPTPNLFLLGLGTNPIDGVYGFEMGQYCYLDHPK
jgi:hypothetical protein